MLGPEVHITGMVAGAGYPLMSLKPLSTESYSAPQRSSCLRRALHIHSQRAKEATLSQKTLHPLRGNFFGEALCKLFEAGMASDRPQMAGRRRIASWLCTTIAVVCIESSTEAGLRQ